MTAKKDPNLTRAEALSKAWKNRKDYKGYEKGKGTAFNSWRSILYAEKGIHIGAPESWRDFQQFLKDVAGEWSHGKIVCRYDATAPYGPGNAYWADKGAENSAKLVRLAYLGEEKSILEWCAQFELNYQGVRQRYFRGKDLTPEEVLFGRKKKVRTPRERDQAFRTLRMLGAYKLKDRRKGLVSDLTLENFRKLVSSGCVYCGDLERVGLDRLDNKLGHAVDNVVPCCYSCNTARNDNFTHAEMLIIGKSIRQVKEARNAQDS